MGEQSRPREGRLETAATTHSVVGEPDATANTNSGSCFRLCHGSSETNVEIRLQPPEDALPYTIRNTRRMEAFDAVIHMLRGAEEGERKRKRIRLTIGM